MGLAGSRDALRARGEVALREKALLELGFGRLGGRARGLSRTRARGLNRTGGAIGALSRIWYTPLDLPDERRTRSRTSGSSTGSARSVRGWAVESSSLAGGQSSPVRCTTEP